MSNTFAVVHVENISDTNLTLNSTLKDVLISWDLLVFNFHEPERFKEQRDCTVTDIC